MSVRLIIGGYEGDSVALYDSVTGFAFGPVLENEDEAEDFLKYVEEKEDGRDPRDMTDGELGELLKAFREGTQNVD